MFRTGYFLDDQAPEQDDWNAAFRWTARDLAWFMAYLLFGDSAATGDAVVVDGLECTAGSGMQTDYTAGAALHYDASVYTATLKGNETASPFGVQMVTAAGSITHAANSSGSTRVDIITISGALGTDTPENVQQDGGSTTSQDTRWGTEATVAITEGTPGAGVPATPTGHTKVAEVSIPNGAGSAAAFTYTDTRYYARKPWKVSGNGGSGTVDMAEATRDDADESMRLSWSRDEHWPIFTRTGEPAGDFTSSMFLMGSPSSREWSHSYPLRAATEYQAAGTGISWDGANGHTLVINRSGDGTTFYNLIIPGEDRGLEVTGVTLRWLNGTAWDGTIATQSWEVYHVDGSTGTATLITGTETFDLGSTNTITASAATMASTPVMDSGDYLECEIELSASGGSTGNLALYSVEITYKEGRA